MKTKNTQSQNHPQPQPQPPTLSQYRRTILPRRRKQQRERTLAAIAAMNGLTPAQAARRILNRELDSVSQELALPTML